jgi:tetratricopeptide (TPR) repeat protein
MATPHELTPGAAPADPVAGHPTADLNATASGMAPLAAFPAPSLTEAHRYVLGDELARGGMGVVYRATDTALDREVAVKVLQEKFGPGSGAARRFADEARITGQLQHPAIPPVHDLGTLPDGRPFLAMKLIKGQTLDVLLKARTSPGEERGRFVAVFEQVCQALACAHDHGVIHRDLKPANVMVGNYGEVQVMDWGLAKVLGPRPATMTDPDATRAGTEIQSLRDSDGEFTQAGSILGTPAFMPPEQAIGAVDQVDARSDVFGLGGILCVILTGRPPFEGDSAESIRQAAAKGKVAEAFASLDACGAESELIALCKRCLAAEKEDRPADAGEVAGKVAGLRTAAEERARRAELERAAAEARSAERRKRRRLAVAAAVVLAAAVVGGLSAVLLVQRRANADLAEKSQELADKNTELADKQAKVEQRFELAQKAIAKLHSGVSEDMLLKSDQFKELRTQLLKEAAGFYGDLEKMLEGEADAKSRRLLADGYFQLATLTSQLGSRLEALELHQKALVVRRKLATAPDADAQTRLDVTRSLHAVGLLVLRSDPEGALRVFREQQEIAQTLAEEPSAQGVLAQSFMKSALALWMLGRSTDALATAEKGLAIQRRLTAANSDSAEAQFELAHDLEIVQEFLWESGKWVENLAALEESRAVLEKLSRAHPGVTQYRYVLAIADNNIGCTLFDEGKTLDALAAHEKGRDESKRLVETQPGVADFPRIFAVNLTELGRALADLGKLSEAQTVQQQALPIFQRLAEAERGNLMSQFYVAQCYNELGQLLALTGKPAAALTNYEKARAVLEQPAEVNLGFHRLPSELARSLENTALLLSTSGNHDEGLAACRKALAIRQKVSDAQPTLAWLQSQLAGSFLVLAAVQQRAGQSAEAVASLRQALGLLGRLPTLTPRNHYAVACCHALLAGIARDTGSGMRAEQGTAEAELAMCEFRRAIVEGYSSMGTLRTDVRLETLRPRADFQKLVKELEEKAAKAQKTAPIPGPR